MSGIMSGAKLHPMDELRQMTELERKIAGTQLDFVDYANDRLSFEKNYDAQRTQAAQMNSMYCRAAMMLCSAPLRMGVRPTSVLKSIGVCLGCCLFSKTFRNEMSSIVRTALYPMVCDKADKFGPDSVWAKRKEQMIAAENGGYLPLTPESAAIMKVAFCKQAYEKMREPGANVNEILEQYQSAEDALYRHAKQDGISAQELDKSMRTIVGNLIDHDPNAAKIFTETAYGVVKRGPNTVHRYRVQTKNGVQEDSYERWEGTYQDAVGNDYTRGFRPRPPETVNDMRQMQKDMWYQMMSEAKTPQQWASVVASDAAIRMQTWYTEMMQEDNHMSEEDLLYHMNDFMGDADISWMTDYGGEDPFHAAGVSMDYDSFIMYGPQQEGDASAGSYPEFKAAFGKWLTENETYSPAYWQRKANDLYQTGGMSDDTLHEIKSFLTKRDELLEQWDSVFAGLNDGFGFQKRTTEPTPVKKEESLPLKRSLPSMGAFDMENQENHFLERIR